ncbi:MAG: DUF3078 domain-containing protein [Bacteroidales bacterium]|nr:DUF3078 domain-containing protein [Bacteroidales bacterium]
MKKLLLTLTMFIFASQMIFAQDAEEKNWTHGGFVGLNVSQSHFSNWTSGGQDNINGLGTFKYSANYLKGKSKWDNNIDFALGYSYFDFDMKPLKTDDRINLSSLYGYDVVKDELYITANLNFQTQFADGFDYKTDSTNKISKFLAPAYLTVGLGAQYTPASWFSLNLAPASGRLTIVNDETLSAAGAFGVTPGKMLRMELGAQLIANVNYEIFKNVVFSSKLVVFYDYMQTREFNALDKEYGCRFDFDWDNAIVMKVNNWLNCNVTARLVYDEDIKPIEGDSFLQFKEVLSVGISYRIP